MQICQKQHEFCIKILFRKNIQLFLIHIVLCQYSRLNQVPGADKQTVENVSDAPWKETIDENAQKKILTTFQNTLDAIMLVKKERGNQVQ